MSYFDHLASEIREIMLWADLRHEQGVAVTPRVSALSRRLGALKRWLERAGPPKSLQQDEPGELAAIQALRPKGARRMWRRFRSAEYADRVRGGFIGRAAGCTLGAPVEGWPPERMAKLAAHLGVKFPPTDYWPAVDQPYGVRYGRDLRAAYTKPEMRWVPVDDDMTYTLLGLLILEEYGPKFTTRDVGRAWLKYLPTACTAERVALDNLRSGASWKQTAERNNPFMEWIGADIRSDAWGYACPGWPERAAEMAYRDAYLSHRHNGIYGEMYFSAVIAAAFAVEDPLEALRVGLSEIPRTSRLYKDVSWALKAAPKVRDHVHAKRLVDRRFAGMSTVHTNNNACLTVWGVAIGGRDLTKAIGATVAMGYDCDCTAATVGSIVGAAIGARNIPAHWYKPFRNRCRTYMNGQEWFTIADICRRFVKAARATFERG